MDVTEFMHEGKTEKFNFCSKHNIELKEYTSKKTGKPYIGHYQEGVGMCFGDTFKLELEAKPAETREPVKETDWDEVARGKIRSLFIEAHISKNGMVRLTEGELIVLDELVEVAMGRK